MSNQLLFDEIIRYAWGFPPPHAKANAASEPIICTMVTQYLWSLGHPCQRHRVSMNAPDE